MHGEDSTEAFRLRYVVELFYRHRELLDAGADEEAGEILGELAEVASRRRGSCLAAQMQKVWWARALGDAQARAERLRRPVAVVAYAERGCAVRRGVTDLPEIDDALCELLERSHAALLRVRSWSRAADRLGELRRAAMRREGDVESRQACFARALCRVHASCRAAGDDARADAVLDELRRVATRAPAIGPRVVAFTEALLCASRAARGRVRARLLAELRERGEHPCAREESRRHFREARRDRGVREDVLERGYRSEP